MTIKDTKYYLKAFFQEYTICHDSFIIKKTNGEQISVVSKSILLAYLSLADGTSSTEKLISFRELPDGINYCNAFQDYAPDRLAKYFKQNLKALCKTCENIGGSYVDLGDAGFEFYLFPKIKITLVYYLGEEAFPAGASLLFDSNVSHYMLTAGIAYSGSFLVDVLINNSMFE